MADDYFKPYSATATGGYFKPYKPGGEGGYFKPKPTGTATGPTDPVHTAIRRIGGAGEWLAQSPVGHGVLTALTTTGRGSVAAVNQELANLQRGDVTPNPNVGQAFVHGVTHPGEYKRDTDNLMRRAHLPVYDVNDPKTTPQQRAYMMAAEVGVQSVVDVANLVPGGAIEKGAIGLVRNIGGKLLDAAHLTEPAAKVAEVAGKQFQAIGGIFKPPTAGGGALTEAGEHAVRPHLEAPRPEPRGPVAEPYLKAAQRIVGKQGASKVGLRTASKAVAPTTSAAQKAALELHAFTASFGKDLTATQAAQVGAKATQLFSRLSETDAQEALRLFQQGGGQSAVAASKAVREATLKRGAGIVGARGASKVGVRAATASKPLSKAEAATEALNRAAVAGGKPLVKEGHVVTEMGENLQRAMPRGVNYQSALANALKPLRTYANYGREILFVMPFAHLKNLTVMGALGARNGARVVLEGIGNATRLMRDPKALDHDLTELDHIGADIRYLGEEDKTGELYGRGSIPWVRNLSDASSKLLEVYDRGLRVSAMHELARMGIVGEAAGARIRTMFGGGPESAFVQLAKLAGAPFPGWGLQAVPRAMWHAVSEHPNAVRTYARTNAAFNQNVSEPLWGTDLDLSGPLEEAGRIAFSPAAFLESPSRLGPIADVYAGSKAKSQAHTKNNPDPFGTWFERYGARMIPFGGQAESIYETLKKSSTEPTYRRILEALAPSIGGSYFTNADTAKSRLKHLQGKGYTPAEQIDQLRREGLIADPNEVAQPQARAPG